MNAEALIGTVLGSCTLQRLIGQGGMGAVYLAQQSRPRRQVAVKVLLPMTQLTPQQHAAFLERFRRETDAAASLEHPNILPVHEYGEREGLAYLVMPYVSGGTLRDEMEREKPLPMSKVVNYLEQVAAALDFAHERGVVHRDVKPANILMTPERRLLLTDFGLVKIVADGQVSQVQLTGIGVPMGTPDYMAPEQVLGGEVDARADIYSLGVLLYHMVTGTVPFKGDMPMQVAMQHLHVPPQPPQALRPELPGPAGQVILRALAKRPADRYARAQDLASAFRVALTVAGVLGADGQGGSLSTSSFNGMPTFTPRGLFDPSWRLDNATSLSLTPSADGFSMTREETRSDIVAQTSMTLPSFVNLMPATGSSSSPMQSSPVAHATPPPLSRPSSASPVSPLRRSPRMSLLRTTDEGISSVPSNAVPPQSPVTDPSGSVDQAPQLPFSNGSGVSISPGTFTAPSFSSSQVEASAISQGGESKQGSPSWGGVMGEQLPFPQPTNSGVGSSSPTGISAPELNKAFSPNVTRNLSSGTGLSLSGITSTLGRSESSGTQGTQGMIKLSQSVRVVQVPVAGQPGRYVTGFLPVLPKAEEPASEAEKPLHTQALEMGRELYKSHTKTVLLAAAALLVLLPSLVWFIASRAQPSGHVHHGANVSTLDIQATVAANATATAEANTILADPLKQNIHNWPIATNGTKLYVFKNGAYHIEDEDDRDSATAIMADQVLPPSFVYSLTMQEIKGDDTSVNNQFGMILRFNSRVVHGKQNTTFYIFEVSSVSGGEYQFWRYDDSNASSPWTKLWSTNFGHEYHFGHGSKAQNAFRVIVNGSKFAFDVNGKRVGQAQDKALSRGTIGMLVNMKGTEVAFSNLLLTYHP